jgi:hypothetical protein
MRGQLRDHRSVLALVSRLGLASLDQELAAGPDIPLYSLPITDGSTWPLSPSAAAPWSAHWPGGSPDAV